MQLGAAKKAKAGPARARPLAGCGAVAGRCAGQPGSYQIAPPPPRARLTKGKMESSLALCAIARSEVTVMGEGAVRATPRLAL